MSTNFQYQIVQVSPYGRRVKVAAFTLEVDALAIKALWNADAAGTELSAFRYVVEDTLAQPAVVSPR